MENEVKVNFSPEGNTGILLIGKANTPEQPRKLNLDGDFSAVGNYLKVKRNGANEQQYVCPENTVVICDKRNLTIHLMTDPNDVFATEVTGRAEFSDELKGFGINQSKFFNREQLIKLIRYNRRFFPNKEENANLLSAYQTFSASVSKNIQEESDLRGNRNNQFQKKVNTTLPENFIIEIPIFKGETSVSFPVDICMEDYDSGMRFWFESVELAELIAAKTDELFERELQYCKDFAVIFK